MKVDGDSEACFGSGLCAQTAPKVFDQEEGEGTVVVLTPHPPPDQHDLVRQAAKLCPARAISVAE